VRRSSKSYYSQSGFECWDVIEALGLNYNLGCVLKYLFRAGKKTPDPKGDLKKAISYLERELEMLPKRK
jgi:hypothetical protein